MASAAVEVGFGAKPEAADFNMGFRAAPRADLTRLRLTDSGFYPFQRNANLASQSGMLGACSFDDLVSAGEQQWRQGEALRFRSRQIDDQLELGRVLHRQVSRFNAGKNAPDVAGSLPVQAIERRSEADQPTSGREFAQFIRRRNAMAQRQCSDLLPLIVEERVRPDQSRIRRQAGDGGKGNFKFVLVTCVHDLTRLCFSATASCAEATTRGVSRYFGLTNRAMILARGSRSESTSNRLPVSCKLKGPTPVLDMHVEKDAVAERFGAAGSVSRNWKTMLTWSRCMPSGTTSSAFHKTLRTSPAIAAGIEKRLWSMEDVVVLIDGRSAKIGGETLVG